MTEALLAVEWRQRRFPLEPAAVVARGVSASRLARRLAAADAAMLRSWRGARASGWLVVIGPGLPWVDGVTYLGREPDCGLLLPTLLEPAVPASLLERALLRRFPDLRPPLGVLSDGSTLPLGLATVLDEHVLRAWQEAPT